jgi:hypothetical protein
VGAATGVDEEVPSGEQDSGNAAKKYGFGSGENIEIGGKKVNITLGPCSWVFLSPCAEQLGFDSDRDWIPQGTSDGIRRLGFISS